MWLSSSAKRPLSTRQGDHGQTETATHRASRSSDSSLFHPLIKHDTCGLVARYRRRMVVVTVMHNGNPQGEVLPWRTSADQRALCEILMTQDVAHPFPSTLIRRSLSANYRTGFRMMYIRVWLMVIYREGQEFTRNRAGRVTVLLPPLLARFVMHPGPSGSENLWSSASWVWFAAVMPGVMLAAASLAGERERGTGTIFRLAPISTTWVMIVKIGVVGLIAMASEVVLWSLIPHPYLVWPLDSYGIRSRIWSFDGGGSGPSNGLSACKRSLIRSSDGNALCQRLYLSRFTAYDDFMADLDTGYCLG